MLPRGSVKTDWEVELGIVTGKKTRYVTQEKALEHVVGYVLVNDIMSVNSRRSVVRSGIRGRVVTLLVQLVDIS